MNIIAKFITNLTEIILTFFKGIYIYISKSFIANILSKLYFIITNAIKWIWARIAGEFKNMILFTLLVIACCMFAEGIKFFIEEKKELVREQAQEVYDSLGVLSSKLESSIYIPDYDCNINENFTVTTKNVYIEDENRYIYVKQFKFNVLETGDEILINQYREKINGMIRLSPPIEFKELINNSTPRIYTYHYYTGYSYIDHTYYIYLSSKKYDELFGGRK